MRRAFALAATICLASCSETTPPPVSLSEPTSIPVAVDSAGEPPAPETFVDTDASPLTREELIGMWGLRSGCGQPAVFSEDGSFSDYTGQPGQWSLQGDLLTITKPGQSYSNEVNPLNANTFSASPPDDHSGRIRTFVVYQRC